MGDCESRYVRAPSPKASVYISDSLPPLVHLIRHYYNARHHPDFRTFGGKLGQEAVQVNLTRCFVQPDTNFTCPEAYAEP